MLTYGGGWGVENHRVLQTVALSRGLKKEHELGGTSDNYGS
jgi:hypothetical protein